MGYKIMTTSLTELCLGTRAIGPPMQNIQEGSFVFQFSTEAYQKVMSVHCQGYRIQEGVIEKQK